MAIYCRTSVNFSVVVRICSVSRKKSQVPCNAIPGCMIKFGFNFDRFLARSDLISSYQNLALSPDLTHMSCQVADVHICHLASCQNVKICNICTSMHMQSFERLLASESLPLTVRVEPSLENSLGEHPRRSVRF